jgi:putative membrane protein
MTGDTEKKVTLDVSTRLAFERTRTAYDRTMMAWIRTAASLISFGFSIYKFFEFERRSAEPSHLLIGPREFAILMVAVGLISLLLGTVEYRQNMRLLRAEYPDMARSRTGVLAGLMSLLGILALIAVILRQ